MKDDSILGYGHGGRDCVHYMLREHERLSQGWVG